MGVVVKVIKEARQKYILMEFGAQTAVLFGENVGIDLEIVGKKQP